MSDLHSEEKKWRRESTMVIPVNIVDPSFWEKSNSLSVKYCCECFKTVNNHALGGSQITKHIIIEKVVI